MKKVDFKHVTPENIMDYAFAVACEGYTNYYALNIEHFCDNDRFLFGVIVGDKVELHKLKIHYGNERPFVIYQGRRLHMDNFIRTDIF